MRSENLPVKVVERAIEQFKKVAKDPHGKPSPGICDMLLLQTAGIMLVVALGSMEEHGASFIVQGGEPLDVVNQCFAVNGLPYRLTRTGPQN